MLQKNDIIKNEINKKKSAFMKKKWNKRSKMRERKRETSWKDKKYNKKRIKLMKEEMKIQTIGINQSFE